MSNPAPGPREPRPLSSDRPAVNRDEPATDAQVRVMETAELFPPGAAEVRLRHRGEEYRLRITRQGKLILTK